MFYFSEFIVVNPSKVRFGYDLLVICQSTLCCVLFCCSDLDFESVPGSSLVSCPNDRFAALSFKLANLTNSVLLSAKAIDTTQNLDNHVIALSFSFQFVASAQEVRFVDFEFMFG